MTSARRHPGSPAGRRRPAGTLVLVALVGLLVTTGVGCGGDDGPPPAGSTTIRAGGVRFHAIVRGPAATDAPLTVLFLHGASYTSRIWADRGILDRVVDEGYRAVAVDLPGSGDTPATDRAPADVLADLVAEVAPAGRVVVVSPSASGRYSLALLAEHPEVVLAGFVPVAPTGIDRFERPADAPPVPALLVWGADDDLIPVGQAGTLRDQLPGSRLVVIPDGSHAPYDDETDAFLAEVLPFLATLTG